MNDPIILCSIIIACMIGTVVTGYGVLKLLDKKKKNENSLLPQVPFKL